MITRQEAQAAVLLLEEYLSARADLDPEPIPVNPEDPGEGVIDPPHWDDAKDWCNRLLSAAGRDGHCGCRLCRS